MLRKLRSFYERRVVPFLAVNLPWLLWPAYKLLAALSVCFVINIVESVGHITLELDGFFRRQHLGEINPKKRYLLVMRSNHLFKSCVELYGHKFRWAISSDLVYDLLLPIILRYKDITLDVGMSGWKLKLPSNKAYYLPVYKSCWHRISKSEALTQWLYYWKRRSQCPEYFPMKEGILPSSQLIKFLNGNTEKLALIHIKTNVGNATAKPTDPETYLDALGYLSDLGYRLMFVGREKMPDVFRRYKIINYSESNITSFQHDVQLFNLADIAITAGSGIREIADCLGKPLVFLNSWHLPTMPLYRYCVCVPTLVQKPFGKFLKFREQFELYIRMPLRNEGGEIFPETEYRARNTTSDEILAAVQELMSLKENYQQRSALQERFRQLNKISSQTFSESRVSEYFLNKHIDLFE